MIGGSGDDLLIGGDKVVAAFDHRNRADYRDATGGIDANLSATATVTGDSSVGTDTLVRIDQVIGSEFDDVFVADKSFRDVAGGKSIRIEGRGGDDTIIGNGSTKAFYKSAKAAVTVDLEAGIARGTDAGDVAGVGTDTLSGIDKIVGSDFDDTILGSDGYYREELQGNAGNDYIDGRGGGDRASYLMDDDGIIANLSSSAVTIGGETVAAGTVRDGFGDIDTLMNIESLRSSLHDDVLIGSDKDNSFRIEGGNNKVDGGLGTDRINYKTRQAGGVTVDLDAGTATNALGGTDTLTSIEDVRGSRFDDVITGDSNDNRLDAGDGDDVIKGGAGNDTLDGGAGNDRLEGGSGNDGAVYAGSYENYSIQTGNDSRGLRTLTVTDLSGNEGVDVLTGVEKLYFSDQTIDVVNSIEGTSVSGNVSVLESDGGSIIYSGDGADNGAEVVITDLLLDGSREIEFRNLQIKFSGNISIEDNASLKMTDSVFDIEMDYRNQYDLTVKDHGTLQVDNLVVPTSREMTRWTHRDNAKININGMRTPEQGEWMPIWQSMSDDVTYTADNSDIGITAIALANDDGAVTTNGTVAITNSDLNVELAFPVGSRTITLPDANTRVESWSIDTGIDIDVVDSNLGRVDFDVTPGAHITLQDSSNIHFGWAMGFRQSLEGEAPSATITDLRGGGALYSNQTFDNGSASLTLINSSVAAWWPTTYGNFDLTVDGGTLIDPIAHDNSKLQIKNADLRYLEAQENGTAVLTNSRISERILAKDSGQIEIISSEVALGSFRGFRAVDQGELIIDDAEYTAKDGRFGDVSHRWEERGSHVSAEEAIADGVAYPSVNVEVDALFVDANDTVIQSLSNENETVPSAAPDKAVQKFVEAMAGFNPGDSVVQDELPDTPDQSTSAFGLLSEG